MKRGLAVIMALVLLLGMVSVATAAKAPSTKPSVKKAAPKSRCRHRSRTNLARTLTDHTRIVRSVAFSPDGTIGQRELGRNDKSYGSPTVGLAWVLITAPAKIFSLAFAPDGKTLARCRR